MAVVDSNNNQGLGDFFRLCVHYILSEIANQYKPPIITHTSFLYTLAVLTRKVISVTSVNKPMIRDECHFTLNRYLSNTQIKTGAQTLLVVDLNRRCSLHRWWWWRCQPTCWLHPWTLISKLCPSTAWTWHYRRTGWHCELGFLLHNSFTDWLTETPHIASGPWLKEILRMNFTPPVCIHLLQWYALIIGVFHALEPSLPCLPITKPETGVYLRGGKGVGTSLVPGWESVLGEWYSSIKPQVENGTIKGTFMGDEIVCRSINSNCFDTCFCVDHIPFIPRHRYRPIVLS